MFFCDTPHMAKYRIAVGDIIEGCEMLLGHNQDMDGKCGRTSQNATVRSSS